MHSFRRIDGETRIGIFATRDIKRGEHLTYDYQYGYLSYYFICIYPLVDTFLGCLFGELALPL